MASKDGLLTEHTPPDLKAIAWNFLALGATAFGGPPVHISMYQTRLVEGLHWLSIERFMELFAMANCLPGPSSTQVAFAIGITQQGVFGGLVAGFSFIFPGAIVMTALGFAAASLNEEIAKPGSPANAVAIACSAVGVSLVFVAVTGLVKKAVFDRGGDVAKLGSICCGTAAVCLLVSPPPAWMNPVLIVLGGLVTAILPTKAAEGKSSMVGANTGQVVGLPATVAAGIFALYLILAIWTIYMDSFDHGWRMPFLTAGMFVWGGGPVVLPMLMTYLAPNFIQSTVFLTGIALAEMMPGPVFNMSCFLGVQLALAEGSNWLAGVAVCWLGLMGPGITLIFGAVPLWDKLRGFDAYTRALPGLNSAAVGLLVSTVFVVYGTLDARSPYPAGSRAIALLSYCAVEMVKINVLLVVMVAGVVGFVWSVWEN